MIMNYDNEGLCHREKCSRLHHVHVTYFTDPVGDRTHSTADHFDIGINVFMVFDDYKNNMIDFNKTKSSICLEVLVQSVLCM